MLPLPFPSWSLIWEIWSDDNLAFVKRVVQGVVSWDWWGRTFIFRRGVFWIRAALGAHPVIKELRGIDVITNAHAGFVSTINRGSFNWTSQRSRNFLKRVHNARTSPNAMMESTRSCLVLTLGLKRGWVLFLSTPAIPELEWHLVVDAHLFQEGSFFCLGGMVELLFACWWSVVVVVRSEKMGRQTASKQIQTKLHLHLRSWQRATGTYESICFDLPIYFKDEASVIERLTPERII